MMPMRFGLFCLERDVTFIFAESACIQGNGISLFAGGSAPEKYGSQKTPVSLMFLILA